MKPAIIAKVRGLTVVLLLLLAVSVAPVAACEPGTPCGSNNGTDVTENPVVGDPVQVELSGAAKNVVTEKALQSSDVKKLQTQLKEKGYSANGSKAYTFDVSLKDGTVVKVQAATFQYSSSDGKELDINYVENLNSGESFVVLSAGASCLTCIVRLIASGGACLTFCVAGGVFTGGVGCIACLGLLSAWTACPCYHCACESFGQACDLAAMCTW
jgi:hypothetical protein